MTKHSKSEHLFDCMLCKVNSHFWWVVGLQFRFILKNHTFWHSTIYMFFTISISVHFTRLCNILCWIFLPNLIIFKVIGSKFYKQQCYIIRLIISQGCFSGGQEEGFKMVMMELMKDFISLLLYLKSAKKKKNHVYQSPLLLMLLWVRFFFLTSTFRFVFHMQYPCNTLVIWRLWSLPRLKWRPLLQVYLKILFSSAEKINGTSS